MPTPQAQGASRTLALLSCTHPQFLFSSLCCIKAGTGKSQSPPNTTQHIQTTDCSQDQSQPHRTSRNKLWVLLVRKESSTCCAKATKGFVSVMYNTRCLGLEQPEGSHSQHRYFTSTLIFAPFQQNGCYLSQDLHIHVLSLQKFPSTPMPLTAPPATSRGVRTGTCSMTHIEGDTHCPTKCLPRFCAASLTLYSLFPRTRVVYHRLPCV